MEKKIPSLTTIINSDPTAFERKKDHIKLAFDSQVDAKELDKRFYYEPMISAHPTNLTKSLQTNFLGNHMDYPIWVSSMTGGTELAKRINENLARMCGEFKLGMGLGSCRSLLNSRDRLQDFNVRQFMPGQPLYANLGICQLEELIEQKRLYKIEELIGLLDADGLIIHVNPLQEWLQPEGDIVKMPPIESIARLIDYTDIPIIVKEVGQGFGPESMEQLLKLPIKAIDFASNGGTNFSKLEMLRGTLDDKAEYSQLGLLGHSAEEMLTFYNNIIEKNPSLEKPVIISGGVRNFLDGHYYINKVNTNANYGQASAFLKHACNPYEDLKSYTIRQIEGLKLANAYLKVR